MSDATAYDFLLGLDLGNAAMSTAEDVAEALEHVAQKVRAGALEGNVRDLNGNTVGRFDVTYPEREEDADTDA